MFRRFIFKVHRITGTAIAAFFLMWFVTGVVLLYHDYPKVSDRELREHLEVLPLSLPDVGEVMSSLPDSVESLTLRMFQGQALFEAQSGDSSVIFCADTTQKPLPITYLSAEREARKWVDAPVVAVDTLHERVQWILYSRYEKELPIYRFCFGDAQKHEVFVSSRTAEVQQVTTLSERVWAWLGAIPHKLYFPFIRKDADVWKWTITVGGAFCLLAALSGAYVGVDMLLRHRRQKKRWGSPYRRFTWKWHHLLGLVFGIFIIAWGLSGMMAMQKIPQWLVPVKAKGELKDAEPMATGMLSLNDYHLDYRLLRQTYPELKQVEWTSVGGKPVYRIVDGKKERCIDAGGEKPKELKLTAKDVEAAVVRLHGSDRKISVSLMNEYDEYYLSRSGMRALPVYKIDVDDEDHTTYYINPANGDTRSYTDNKRVRKWVFSGIHYLNVKWLVERPVLWTIVIWLLCIGGTIVSLTGTIMGVKYLRRTFGRKGKKK